MCLPGVARVLSIHGSGADQHSAGQETHGAGWILEKQRSLSRAFDAASHNKLSQRGEQQVSHIPGTREQRHTVPVFTDKVSRSRFLPELFFGDLRFLLSPATCPSMQSPSPLPIRCFEKKHPHFWRNTGHGARLRTWKRPCASNSVCTLIVLNVIYLCRRSDRQNERPNSIPAPSPRSWLNCVLFSYSNSLQSAPRPPCVATGETPSLFG